MEISIDSISATVSLGFDYIKTTKKLYFRKFLIESYCQITLVYAKGAAVCISP